MSDQRQWHRLFGISLIDLFHDQPAVVEVEKDLSHKSQLLDVVVVRTDGGPITGELPDGFAPLARHNLITFKSLQEPLDGTALNELVGHYVNYRKQVSPSFDDRLPEADFRLFAVCVRSPRTLDERVPWERVADGVYRTRHFTGEITVVVVHELPREPRNVLLCLFSAQQEQIQYGMRGFKARCGETTTFLQELYDQLRREGIAMPYTMEDFKRECREKLAKDTETVDWLLKHLPDEQKLEGVPAEKRLEGLSVEELRRALSPEMLDALSRKPETLDDDTTPPTPGE